VTNESNPSLQSSWENHYHRVRLNNAVLLSHSFSASTPPHTPNLRIPAMKCLLQLRLTDTFPDWTVWIPDAVSDQFIPSMPMCSSCLVPDIYLKFCCKLFAKVFQSFRFCFEKYLICITYFLAALLWPSTTLLSLTIHNLENIIKGSHQTAISNVLPHVFYFLQFIRNPLKSFVNFLGSQNMHCYLMYLTCGSMIAWGWLFGSKHVTTCIIDRI